MTMQVLGAVTEFDRDLLIERAQSDLKRAKAEGKTLSHPKAYNTTAAVRTSKPKAFHSQKRRQNLESALPQLRAIGIEHNSL